MEPESPRKPHLSILVDIGHPGHVHLFRNPIRFWQERGHRVVVAIRSRGIVGSLLNQYGIKHQIVSKMRTSFFGLVYELIEHDFGLIRLALRHKTEVMVGTSVCITHAGMLLRIPSLVVNEDDKDYLHAWALIAYPFANRIIVPFILRDKKTAKYLCHGSLHELAYLHPDHFIPDPSVLADLGLKKGERFFIVRFVAFQAHHDTYQRGLNLKQRSELIDLLQRHGRVFLSTENQPDLGHAHLALPITPDRIHHAMFYASLVVGDSQTMAVESAVLGTPAIRCNTFCGRCSIITEIEERYGLIHSFHPVDFPQMLERINQLLADPDLESTSAAARQRLLADKGNFSVFLAETVENRGRGPKYTPTLEQIAFAVLGWMERRAYRGSDPYQLDDKLNLFPSTSPFRPLMVQIRAALKPLHPFIPKAFFSATPPVLMPKVLGLVLSGLAHLVSRMDRKTFEAKASALADLLRRHRSNCSPHLCWGHPFRWGASIRYEPDTPSVPVTAIIGHGMLDAVDANFSGFSDSELLSVADYLIEGNGFKDFGDSLCFYYAPNCADLTYNTSVIAATYLLRISLRSPAFTKYQTLAHKALRFLLEGQNLDGSWFYTDPRGDSPWDKTIDGRHTGFILEHLAMALQLLPEQNKLRLELHAALDRGTTYFLQNLMDGPVPRWSPQTTYPVDIKDAAQAIITLACLGKLDLAKACWDFTREHFFDGSAAFWFKLHADGFTNKAVFIRWAQAWMFKALAILDATEHNK